MAVQRVYMDTARGLTGYPCHGCGHTFERGETIWQLNVTDAYAYWCDSCASRYPVGPGV